MRILHVDVPAALRGQAIAVVDVEGNGQNPPEIIEIAIIPVDGNTVSADDVRSWLIQPRTPITPIVTRKVHGITNEDVAACPMWDTVAPEIRHLLHSRTLVAHNASVENKVLTAHLPDWRPPMALDTLRLAKVVWPGLRSYALDKLIGHAQLDMSAMSGQSHHRATYDAWAAWQLLCRLVQDGELDWSDVVGAAGLPMFVEPREPENGLW